MSDLVTKARLLIRWTREWCDGDLIYFAEILPTESLGPNMTEKTARKIIAAAKDLGNFCYLDFLTAWEKGEVSL